MPLTATDHKTDHTTDVLIVGAGPSGLALSVALAQAGLRCTVLEQAPLASLESPPEDGRDIALTHRARRILESLGIWQRLPADEIAPLRQAHVRNGSSSWVLPFDARDDGHEALGWLVPNHLIRAACWQAASSTAGIELRGDAKVIGFERDGQSASVRLAQNAQSASVHLAQSGPQESSEPGQPSHHYNTEPTWRAPLVIAADSRFSSLRRMAGIAARSLDFGRTAIVCRMQHTQEHQGIAHECFRYGNTLAMLPMAGRQSSAVLTVKAQDAAEWLALSPESFASRIASQFDQALGAMTLAGERHSYPLVGVMAERFSDHRIALIGDAAVGMHPVTAHGYNFGLYGVETLAAELTRARRLGRDLGDARVLARYGEAHRRLTLPIYLGTNAIVQLFTNDRPGAKLLRAGVLRLASKLPPLRTAITRQLTGRAGAPAPAAAA